MKLRKKQLFLQSKNIKYVLQRINRETGCWTTSGR